MTSMEINVDTLDKNVLPSVPPVPISAEEQDALNEMTHGYQRLKVLGWREAIYCPKDKTRFLSIEPGCSGVYEGWYEGEWPKGTWWTYDGDVWPAHPCLFKMKEEKTDAE